MDISKRVVMAFLDSVEGYFHNKAIIADGIKQPLNLYGPSSNHTEKWNYTDIRDITKEDLKKIVDTAAETLDIPLYKIVQSTALNAALQMTIHTLDNGKFQSKIDSNTYNSLYKILSLKVSGMGV